MGENSFLHTMRATNFRSHRLQRYKIAFNYYNYKVKSWGWFLLNMLFFIGMRLSFWQ